MRNLNHRHLIVLFAALGLSAPAFAQQDTGGGAPTGGGDAALDAALAGASGNTGGGENAFTSLDADTAFSAIDRGATVGANNATVGTAEFGAGGGGAAGLGGGGLGGLGGLGGGGFGGLGGLGNLFGGFGSAAPQASQRPIRTRLRSAVQVAPMPVAVVQRNALSRFRSLPSTPALRGVNVVVRDGTAVLSGNVATASDRRMSELLMRLEPGIRAVDNQVTVSQ